MEYDISYQPSTLPATQTIDKELCPYHAKLEKQKAEMGKKSSKKGGGVNFLTRLIGKSSLQQKLDLHNIKMKVKIKRINKTSPWFSEM